MKLRPLTMLLSLFAGALVTLAIPDLLPTALRIRMPATLDFESAEPRAMWDAHAPDNWPEPDRFVVQHSAFVTCYEGSISVNDAATHWLREFQAGWPCRAKRSRWYMADGTVRIEGSIWHGDMRGVMPLGFAIDTFIYATLLGFTFWYLPLQLRRWWRIRRCLCPACAYPVGESPLCSECGSPR